MKHRWRAALDARETRLAAARRSIIVAAADHRWPGELGTVAPSVEITARGLRAISAFVLGVGVVAIGMGVPDPLSAESGALTIAYARALSFYAVVASWLDLG